MFSYFEKKFSFFSSGSEMVPKQQIAEKVFNEYQILSFGEPARAEFQLISKRYKTFVNWPAGLAQKRDEMARAGFFYIGN